MKDLPIKFTGKGEVRGYEFTQIHKTDKAFMYEVDGSGTTYWEVFKKVVNKRFNTITYPSSKGFGIYAWTYSNLEQATKKYEEINARKDTENLQAA